MSDQTTAEMYSETATVTPVLSRGFAIASVALLTSVSQFLDTTPIAFEGSTPEGRAQDNHVDGLNLLRDAIQTSLDVERPTISCKIGLVDDEGQSVTLAVGANDPNWLIGFLRHAGEFAANYVEVENFAQCEDELLQARVAIEQGRSYQGELVKINIRPREEE